MKKFEIRMKDRIRFMKSVDMSGDCWYWLNEPNKNGYGNFHLKLRSNSKRSTLLAHRVAFALEFGEVNDKLCVCHTCDNPMCVNPSHLWEGTRDDNAKDKAAKGRVAGERNPRAKVTNAQMQCIKERVKSGELVKDLTAEFGYSRCHLYKMLRGEQWKVAT